MTRGCSQRVACCIFWANCILFVSTLCMLQFQWRQPSSPQHKYCKQAFSCSFEDADHHFLCHHNFPRMGFWNTSWEFVPPCKPSSQDKSGSCLFAKNNSRIVILGDSTGLRYANQTINILSSFSACTPLATEVPQNESYFNLSDIISGQTDCSGCNSFSTVCSSEDKYLSVEYIRMEFVLDFELSQKMRSIHYKNCNMDKNPPCKWAWSTQQLLFEHYFQANPPTHIHIFQNLHDCSRRSSADFRRDLHWLFDLIDSSVNPGTHVYYWEATAPHPDRQPPEWVNVTSLACLSDMHKITKDAVYPLVQRTLRSEDSTRPFWHATFSLLQPSLERIDLNYDGVHFQPEFYRMGAETLLIGSCHPGSYNT